MTNLLKSPVFFGLGACLLAAGALSSCSKARDPEATATQTTSRETAGTPATAETQLAAATGLVELAEALVDLGYRASELLMERPDLAENGLAVR